MLKVAIASPIKQKESILKEFLNSLEELKTGNLKIEYVFVDDQNGASSALRKFADEHNNVMVLEGTKSEEYNCTEQTHYWQENIIWKVANLKNNIINYAKDNNVDYLFFIDSDLVLNPNTLLHLINLNKDIVSEVYWTKWAPEQESLPQVWLGGQYRLFELADGEVVSQEQAKIKQQDFLNQLRRPGTYKVGGLGACTLISKKAIMAGVNFSKIDNLDLIGEDRHFCIRAKVLGFELFADTYYPPYHIYRESELEGLQNYKNKFKKPKIEVNRGKVTLAMLVRNEADRYLKTILKHAASYVDSIVVLDDASEDNTIEICKKVVGDKPIKIISNNKPNFNNEIILRKQLWDLAVEQNNEWILILDADEIFEDEICAEIEQIKSMSNNDSVCFRLYDMWNEEYYREDNYWCAHHFYRPFMIRYDENFEYKWLETPQHCGRFPCNINQLKTTKSEVRLKHLGWMKAEDRLNKYYRYQKLDPSACYGIKEQYQSILDPKPNLVKW